MSQGVTVSLTGASNSTTTTDSAGHYSFAGLTAGVYTVRPSLANFTFTPITGVVTVSGADVRDQDFTAAAAQPFACTGDVKITNTQELQAFLDLDCSEVTGTLSITESDISSVTFPSLTTVRWFDVLDNPELVSVRLPLLTSVTGPMRPPVDCKDMCSEDPGGRVRGNPKLEVLAVPALTAFDSFYVYSNESLRSLSMPALLFAGRGLLFYGTSTESVDLPSLASGGVYLTANNRMTHLELPSLTEGRIGIGGDSSSSLTSVILPALTQSEWLWIEGCSALKTLDAPNLSNVGVLAVVASGPSNVSLPALESAEELRVLWNCSLATIQLPALVSITSLLDMSNNPVLPQSQVDALLQQLLVVPGWLGIGENGTGVTCPP